MSHRAFSPGEHWIRGTDCSEHEILSIDETHVTTISPPPAQTPQRNWSADQWDDSAEIELKEGPSFKQGDSTSRIESWHGTHSDFTAEFFPPQAASAAA